MTFSVDESELYDGPIPEQARPAGAIGATSRPAALAGSGATVRPLFTQPQPVRQGNPALGAQYVAILNAALAIISTRLLAFLAVIGAVIMFGYGTYDPSPWRTYTIIAYAAVVLWPLVYLHLKQGMTQHA